MQSRATCRQHYAAANARQKTSVPNWVKCLVIIICIGLGGALAGCADRINM